MVNKIIWLSFLLGVSSTIATLLYLLSAESDPKNRNPKQESEPRNIRKLHPDIAQNMRHAEQATG